MAAATINPTSPADRDFHDYLESEKAKDLLRFTTAGSVDDGKSTLIGRLLYDSRSIYDDQLESVTKSSAGRNAGTIDFSLLTDGLRAEREQGITIDVAYRYFATPRRKFIIADTPGHEQYTRNMATGASTAELAIVLVDARKGLLPQSRRHAYIASLLALPHVVIAVNKMDLVGYEQSVFAHIETEFRRFLARLGSIQPYFLPISALEGDNVVKPSTNMPWFHGPNLLEHLETVPVGNRTIHSPFRFPVQRVVRPSHEFRGYAGTISAGTLRAGDAVTVLPSGRTTTVSRIVTFDGDLESAQAGQSVTLALADEVDVSRGDILASGQTLPRTGTLFDATLVWLQEQPAELERRYRLKQGTRVDSAAIQTIHYRVNINTLEHEPAESLEMNAIGQVRIEVARPIAFDTYVDNRVTGSFILIDSVTNATVAAGMINGAASSPNDSIARTRRSSSAVTAGERVARRGHTGAVISLGGRTDLIVRLERWLFERGCAVIVLDDAAQSVSPALLKAGLLVLLAGSSSQGFSIVTEQGKTELSAASLPTPDFEAADAIQRLLERLQILVSIPNWSESGGGI